MEKFNCQLCGKQLKVKTFGRNSAIFKHFSKFHKTVDRLQYLLSYEQFEIPKCRFCGKNRKRKNHYQVKFSTTCGSFECVKRCYSPSEETRKKISEKLSLNNKGGRSKWFVFKKKNGDLIKVQGKMEFTFSKILEKIDEDWIKLSISNKHHSLKWIDSEGRLHTYTPDFYSPKYNKYYETKGHYWGNDFKKMEIVKEQNKDKIIKIVSPTLLRKYRDKFLSMEEKNSIKGELIRSSAYYTELHEKRKTEKENKKNFKKSFKKQTKIDPIIKMLEDSSIDFSKFGWAVKASKITGISQNKISHWMGKYMPEFYERKCFKKGITKYS